MGLTPPKRGDRNTATYNGKAMGYPEAQKQYEADLLAESVAATKLAEHKDNTLQVRRGAQLMLETLSIPEVAQAALTDLAASFAEGEVVVPEDAQQATDSGAPAKRRRTGRATMQSINL